MHNDDTIGTGRSPVQIMQDQQHASAMRGMHLCNLKNEALPCHILCGQRFIQQQTAGRTVPGCGLKLCQHSRKVNALPFSAG
ncbi:hypothetical protein AA0229_2683 [Gluconobacter cerinus NRIC 0229]|nr:hypothetical protein AA0229_2683 [Gluconobacter cerinus NRIC 0229]